MSALDILVIVVGAIAGVVLIVGATLTLLAELKGSVRMNCLGMKISEGAIALLGVLCFLGGLNAVIRAIGHDYKQELATGALMMAFGIVFFLFGIVLTVQDDA